jgi:hypothetical protein
VGPTLVKHLANTEPYNLVVIYQQDMFKVDCIHERSHALLVNLEISGQDHFRHLPLIAASSMIQHAVRSISNPIHNLNIESKMQVSRCLAQRNVKTSTKTTT